MILPKSDIQLIRDEIQQKAGSLWERSVQRLRDRAISLAFTSEIMAKMNNPSVSYPADDFVIPNSLGTMVDNYVDEYSNTYLRHINVDQLRELHYETSFVNTAFYEYIVDPLEAGDLTRDQARKRLSKIRDVHFPKVYQASKNLLNIIQDKHEQLKAVITTKIHSPNNSLDISEEFAEYLDFMFGLCTPDPKLYSQAERELFNVLQRFLDDNGKIVFDKTSDLQNWISKEVPSKFQAWYDDVSSNLEAWWQQAQKSYGKVLDQLSFNAENN